MMENLVRHELFFDALDKESNCTSLELLFYCIEMPVNLLANQYILLGIVNGANAIAIGVVHNLEGEFDLYILK